MFALILNTINFSTFHIQVFKRYKKALCIVATNVSTMSVEYFHPKTTPDTPVAVAIRASVALPGKPYVNQQFV